MGPATKAAIVFCLLLVIAIFAPRVDSSIDTGSVLGAAAIFYSILLGFYISAAMGNLARLKSLVATETGALIAIYKIVKLSLPDKEEETKVLIDKYLVKRFQYELGDYTEKTTKEFYAIFDILKGANGKSDGENAAINYVAEALYYVAQSRREVSIVSAKIVDRASWLILFVLSVVIMGSLFLSRDGTWASSLTTALLSTSAVMALFVLGDIDGNRFGEEHFAIDTYQDVFDAIGKKHYYPSHYLMGGRFKPAVREYRTDKDIAHSYNLES
jgi:hypothetical protein